MDDYDHSAQKAEEKLLWVQGQLELVTSEPTWATGWDFVLEKKKAQE